MNGPLRDWPMLAPLALLFILPFPGSVALRLVCLLVAIVTAIYMWRRLDVPPLPCKAAIAFWALVAGASAFYAFDPAYTLGEIKNEIGYSMLAFVALFALTRDEARLRLATLAAAAALAVVALAAIATYAWKGGWSLGAWYGEAGPTTHYILIAAPAAALAAYLWIPRHLGKALLALAAIVCALAILSGQRAIWFALAVQGLVVCAWLWREGRLPTIRLRVAVLFLAVAVPLAGLYATDRLRTSTQPWATMDRDLRVQVWKGIVQRIADKPFTGAGFGRQALAKAYPDLTPPENPLFWHGHNIVLNYGLSAGVPGMLAIVALLAAFAARFWRLALHGERGAARAIGLAGAAMVAGIFARNMFNDFFVRDGALLFWALAGAMLGFALRREATLSPALSPIRRLG